MLVSGGSCSRRRLPIPELDFVTPWLWALTDWDNLLILALAFDIVSFFKSWVADVDMAGLD